MKVSKKSGKNAPAALKKGGAKTNQTATSSVSRATGMLYSFQNGVLRTCEVPSMKLETHALRFPKHRCGYFNGKFYFLETNPSCSYANSSDPLRELGTLKTYNPVQKVIGQKLSTCKCNWGEKIPLLIKGNEIIDLGCYPRVINASTGHREPIHTLNDIADVCDFAACLVMNKTIYVAKSIDIPDFENPMYSKCIDDAEDPVQTTEIFAINCAGFQCTLLSSLETPLLNLSIVPVSSKELLVTGEEGVGTVLYHLSGNALVKEGNFAHKLGRCCSSVSLDGALFMFFDSGKVVKRELKSGLMRVYDPLLFESIKGSLWVCNRTGVSRLPHAIVREIFISY